MTRKTFAAALPRPAALITLLAGAALLAALASPPAHAAEVNGVKLADSAKVAGQNLVLSGAGVRIKAVVKVYVLGMYFAKKETTQAGALSAPGPKRFELVTLRDLSSEEFGSAFIAGINKNLDKDEKAKLFNQLTKLGDLFEKMSDGLKKGDVVACDFVPGTGTIFTVNGKQVLEPLPDPLFYNGVLRIWYGDKPADVSLKNALLGETS
jgi:Chalcone isomerase-like